MATTSRNNTDQCLGQVFGLSRRIDSFATGHELGVDNGVIFDETKERYNGNNEKMNDKESLHRKMMKRDLVKQNPAPVHVEL